MGKFNSNFFSHNLKNFQFTSQKNKIFNFLVKKLIFRYRFDIPRIHGHYVGSGDLFACLLLVWLNDTGNNVELAIKNVILSLQLVLKRTSLKAYGKFCILNLNYFLVFRRCDR